ncbi:sensor histidine kinase [Streptomyces antibioticus]|uniref:sensor histidine kinase n=1 Tax=Streptomyces antibioticus TaxID=1890 RepID=UPI0036BEEBC0
MVIEQNQSVTAMRWAAMAYVCVAAAVLTLYMVDAAALDLPLVALAAGASALLGLAAVQIWPLVRAVRGDGVWVAPPRVWLIGQLVLTYLPVLLFKDAWLHVPGLLVASVLLTLDGPRSWLLSAAVVVSVPALVYFQPIDNVLGLRRGLLAAVLGLLLAGAVRLSWDLARQQTRSRYEAELAVLHERQRVTQDLHDGLGLRLATITLRGELAHRLLADGDAARAVQELASVTESARAAQSEMHEALSGRWVLSLRRESEQAEQVLVAAGIRVQMSLDIPQRLATDVESVLALALRELAANVLRHSEAKLCTIRCDASHGEVRVLVQNDGAETSKGAAMSSHIGLRSLTMRAASLGGALRAAGDGKRFTAEVIIPFP